MAEGARDASWRKGLLKVALTVALTVQSPALAGHNYLTEVPGLAVMEDQVIRPDGGSARLLIARIDPGRMLARVVHAGSDSRHLPGLDGRKASGDGTVAPHGDDGSPAWRVLINASYFDENEKSLMLLRDRSREFTGFRKGRGAVFSCTEGRCSIQHARDFDPAAEYDIAVQSTPRVLASARATEGVKNPREVDARAGLAVAEDGSVLAFATEPQFWRGLSFDQVRDHLASTHAARDILMLDGGTSAQMKIIVGGSTFKSGMLYRDVPFRIGFAGSGG
jgi:hypothetical protein